MHAELAHFVARRCNDTAIAVAPHDDGLAPQRRIVELLDGRIERVHVDVQDGAYRIHKAKPATRASEPSAGKPNMSAGKLTLSASQRKVWPAAPRGLPAAGRGLLAGGFPACSARSLSFDRDRNHL